jgi:hypothetical protein
MYPALGLLTAATVVALMMMRPRRRPLLYWPVMATLALFAWLAVR